MVVNRPRYLLIHLALVILVCMESALSMAPPILASVMLDTLGARVTSEIHVYRIPVKIAVSA